MGVKGSSNAIDYRFVVAMTGECGVGKSSIIHQLLHHSFQDDQHFDPNPRTPVDCTLLHGKKTVQLVIHDAPDSFRHQVSTPFARADGVIAVIDVTDANSLINLNKWLQDAHTLHSPYQQERIIGNYMILGNKLDLNEGRVVTEGHVKEVLKVLPTHKYDWFYRETSAKTGSGIKEAFQDLIERLVEYREMNPRTT
eukprot:TRINITY_DN6626_c0_g1_i3.p1 TRINITY_DN6626_c0_g1~~TRINITY_DN6626_c0_g1_i3.p1  ORF type:complete len:196 (-),score=17.92 TRINITY_DN6626_c0_g1_i3:61-648(-)